MNRALGSVIVALLMLLVTERSPAPIVEPTENPTPTAEQSGKPKPKRITKPKVTNENSENSAKREAEKNSAAAAGATVQKNGPYAGTWTGTLNWGIGGNSDHMIVIDPAQKTATVTNVSGSTYPASIGPDGISWVTGIFKEHRWALKPFPDGRTALVTINGHNSAVFRRER